MSYQVEVDFGSGWVDISTKLYGRLPVSSTRAIHKNLKPVIDTARFKIVRDQSLINQFLSATSDVPVRIHKDSSDYFTGIIRPTHKAKIGHIRAESFAIECVDAWYTLDRTFNGSLLVMRSCNVSNPTTKSLSILHQLFYRAGFADASLSLDAIAIPIAAFAVDTTTGSAPTFRAVIEKLLSENGYTAYVDESGVVHLYDLGPASITAALSFSSGAAGNIAEGYDIERREESVEAVDVSYYPPKTMTAQVVFSDTTGGTDLQEATIVIPPGGYYPNGADATHSVDAEYKIDNYEIIDTQSAALVVEVSAGSVPTAQVFTPESKKAKLRLYSSGGCTIKKLNITGTATVKGDLGKAIRENVALTTKREQITLDYVGDATTAARVSILRANWYRDAAYEYHFECTDLSVKPGDYRTFSELAIMGISTTVRVVSVNHGSNEKTVKVTVEAVDEFTVVPVLTESQVISRPRGPSDILALPRISCTSPLVYMTTSGDYDPDEVTFSALRADGTAYAGFWKIWRGGVLGHANTVAAATITVPSELPVADDSVIYETTPFGPVFRAELYADALYETRLDTYNTSILPNVLEKSQALAYAEAEVARLTAEAYADGIVTVEESRAIADAVARRDEAITVASDDATAKANAAEAAANAAVVTYTPRYLGKATSAPTANAIGDCYTKYSVTAGAANRGVFLWDGSAWVRTEERKYIMQALADISYIIAYKDQSDPPVAIYGTASDYTSDSTTQTDFAFFQAAVIGYVEANDLLVRKTFRVGGRYDTAGAVVDDTAAGFYMGASGACKSAGVEFEGTLGGGVQWGGPSLIGTALSISGAIVPSLAALNGTDVAFIDSGNDELRVYRWSGTSWSMVGSGLAISGSGYPSLAALNGTDVAFIDSSNEQLRTYRWSGSSWSLLGSGFSLPNTEYAALAALNGTDVAFINSYHNLLRVFRWSGSSWSSVGSSLSISGSGYPSLAALNGTDVAFIDSSNDELRTYRWSGSNWNIVGSGLAISATGVPALSSLNGSDVAFVDSINDALRVYRWSGSDWSAVPDAGKLTIGGGSPALASLNGTDVAFIDSVNDTLRLYRFQFSLSRPYSRKLTG
jgi:hypothetical protein